MILNSYIIYKQNLSAGCNAMSRLDYTIQIVDALSKEWLEEKNRAVGKLSTNNDENDTKLENCLLSRIVVSAAKERRMGQLKGKDPELCEVRE